MNDINKRFKELREYLELTQEGFGNAIGLSKSGISNIENGTRNVTDRHIKLISNEFNIREEWLRDGQGNMFVETKGSFLSSLANQYNLDELDQVLLESYLSLPADKKKVIKDFIQGVAGAFSGNDEMAAAERRIDEEVESYRKELEAELKGVEKSSVLQDIGGKKEAN